MKLFDSAKELVDEDRVDEIDEVQIEEDFSQYMNPPASDDLVDTVRDTIPVEKVSKINFMTGDSRMSEEEKKEWSTRIDAMRREEKEIFLAKMTVQDLYGEMIRRLEKAERLQTRMRDILDDFTEGR